MKIEKERKFKLSKLPPETTGFKKDHIEQHYLELSKEDFAEGYESKRIRLVNHSKAFLTLKTSGGLERCETETEICLDVFEELKRSSLRSIKKYRYTGPINGFTAEIDAFVDVDLVMAEVESGCAESFVPPPDWIEVTGKAPYSNSRLAITPPGLRAAMICLATFYPQVITESIEAVMYEKDEIPEKIYILNTKGSKTDCTELQKKIDEEFPRLKLTNGDTVSRISIEEIKLIGDEGRYIEDILSMDDVRVLEKYLSETIKTIKCRNYHRIYFNASSGRKIMPAFLAYFAQLYGSDNDCFFQVQLLSKDEEEKNYLEKEYWHDRKKIAYIPIPFYKVNQPEIYNIVSKIDDHDLRRSFITFYNTVSSPACSKLLYGFNLYEHFADHGLNHSLNILKILSNALDERNNNDFALTSEEIYVLSCAALLHDIGMCGSKSINDHTKVRKYHGLISFELLNGDNPDLVKLITDNELNAELIRRLPEISLICKFHQQSSRFFEPPDPATTKDIGREVTTLEHDIVHYLEVTDRKKAASYYKLAAILRVLDAADVQRSRVFNDKVLKKQVEKNGNELEWIRNQIDNLIQWGRMRGILPTDLARIDWLYDPESQIESLKDKIDKNPFEMIKKLFEKYHEIEIQNPQHYNKHMAIEKVEVRDNRFILHPDNKFFESKKIFSTIAMREIKKELAGQHHIFVKNGIKIRDAVINGLPGTEEERKFEVDTRENFNRIVRFFFSDEKILDDKGFADQIKWKAEKIGFQVTKISTAEEITNIDTYYDTTRLELCNTNTRLRIRNVKYSRPEGRKDETYIGIKCPSNSTGFGSIECEPMFYGEVPEAIDWKILNEYFGDIPAEKLGAIDMKKSYEKSCIVETHRKVLKAKFESTSDESRLWVYEIEISLDEISFSERAGNTAGPAFEIEVENTLATSELMEAVCEVIKENFCNTDSGIKEMDIKNESKYRSCIDHIRKKRD